VWEDVQQRALVLAASATRKLINLISQMKLNPRYAAGSRRYADHMEGRDTASPLRKEPIICTYFYIPLIKRRDYKTTKCEL
jgi:hypothetical protein